MPAHLYVNPHIRVLQATVVLAIVTFLVHAVFTQWYETGAARITSPCITAGFAGCFLAFLYRKRWSWRIVTWITVTTIAINLVFWPEAKYFGETLTFARWLVGAEVLFCSVIGIFMLRSPTKGWFSSNDD